MTISTSILLLAYFANFKLAGDRAVRDTVNVVRRPSTNENQNNRNIKYQNAAGMNSNGTSNVHHRGNFGMNRTRRRRRGTSQSIRSRRHQNNQRVSVMTDADLEAELAARRAARLRERERYARAMRSEKLNVLESELLRLRSEISRIDPTFNNRNPPPASSPRLNLSHGTPPNARWESLQPRSHQMNQQQPQQNMLPQPHSPRPGSNNVGPPPPGVPPPPPPMGGGDDDELEKDPETKRREKEERVRRREAKRKEREAAKKPLTLAEIIRGAGPDPMRRLKPSGSTQIPDVHEPEDDEQTEDFTQVKDGLKKIPSSEEPNDKSKDDSKDETETETENSKEPGKEDDENTAVDKDSKNIKENGTEEASKSEDKEGESSAASESNDIAAHPKSVKVKNDVNDTTKKGAAKRTGSSLKSTKTGPSPPPPPPPSSSNSNETASGTSEGNKKASGKDVNAVDALSALAAKLPVKRSGESDKSTSSKPPLPLQQQTSPSTMKKRVSLEERRRQRREAAAANSSSNARDENGGDASTSNTADKN